MTRALAPLVASFAVLVLGCQAVQPVHPAAGPHHGEAPSLALTEEPQPVQALDLSGLVDLDALIPRLADRRVVYVGETHDRYDHHLNQLAIIQGLHRRHPDLAIGMEFFQQPFQAHLDDYLAGRIDEKEMLRRTEWYSRWRFDYRLYQPILRYAREHQIPVIALNLPREITSKVGRQGLQSLSAEERAQIPQDMDRSDQAYRERLELIYRQHPEGGDFENFLSVQLLWDEGMAERAARYLRENPRRHLVVLAGSGHLMYRSGIPKRLNRRLPVKSAVVLNSSGMSVESGMADYLLLSEERPLPPAGRLGIVMGGAPGSVEVASLAPGGAAEEVGIEEGDRILSVDGQAVGSMADVTLVMLGKTAGDRVPVTVMRKGWFGAEQELSFELALR